MKTAARFFLRRWAVSVPAFVLFAATALQGLALIRKEPVSRPPHLAEVLPQSPQGWTSRELPLSSNEFISKVAEKMLNFDEVVFREYTGGARSFNVYVAYWGPGKMPAQLVASHTPDRCWTENGWTCRDMKFRQLYSLGSDKLQPAEWRLFEPPGGGRPVYVLFWHLVQGKAYDFGERFSAVPDPVRWCSNAVKQAVLGNQEQYFVRITSALPLEQLWDDPGFADVMRSVGHLGLVVREARRL